MVSALAVKQAAEMAALLDSSDGRARAEFKELMTWVPEYLPDEVMKSYKDNGGDGVPPFFCEVTLYELLGKDQARSLLGMMRSLGEALGFSGDRDLIDESERDGDEGVDRDSPLSHDDVDALEGFMRYDASYRFRGGDDEANKIIRISKTLPILRSLVGEAAAIGEWTRVLPRDLVVGDRIFSDGRFVTVYGFLDEEKAQTERPVPFGKSLEGYEIPYKFRKGKAENLPGEWLQYAGSIMTAADDDYGWQLKSTEELLIRRKSEAA